MAVKDTPGRRAAGARLLLPLLSLLAFWPATFTVAEATDVMDGVVTCTVCPAVQPILEFPHSFHALMWFCFMFPGRIEMPFCRRCSGCF